jgi:DNA-binding protein Fis
MRDLENCLIDNEIFHKKVNDSLDEYENSMLRNIYLFCKENSLKKAVFMCGAAHRQTISQKIAEYEAKGN